MLVASLLVAVGLGVLTGGLHRARVAVAAEAAVVTLVEEEPPRPGFLYRVFEPLVGRVARVVRTLSPAARLDLTRRRIVYAGLDGRRTVEQVLASRAVAAAAGLLFGLAAHPQRVPAVLAGLVLGVLASFVPDVVLDARARRRQAEVARALPDALDLLAITVESGLGLEQALEVVTERLSGPLGDELRRLLREVELGVDRRQALALLRERTDVRELSAFVVALLQADELGIAVGDVLRVQAGHVRMLRRQRAREQAAKTPVKILFPVVLGIFPSLFVVTVGPGAIAIARSLFS